MGGNGETTWKHRRADETAERAVWSEQERRDYRKVNRIQPSQPPLSEPKALALWYFSQLPRPLLVLLALAAVAYMAKGENLWRTRVETHINLGETAMRRLGLVEHLANSTSEQVRLLREEQMRSRVDQLDFYRWMAEDRGDTSRAKRLTRELIVARSRIEDKDISDELSTTAASPAEPPQR